MQVFLPGVDKGVTEVEDMSANNMMGALKRTRLVAKNVIKVDGGGLKKLNEAIEVNVRRENTSSVGNGTGQTRTDTLCNGLGFVG